MLLLKSKKGTTEAVLVIGTVLIAAVIISLGAARVIVPLLKTEPEFIAIQGSAAVQTALAAPETVNFVETFAKNSKILYFGAPPGGKILVGRGCGDGATAYGSFYSEDKSAKSNFLCPHKNEGSFSSGVGLLPGEYCTLQSDEEKVCFWAAVGSSKSLSIAVSKQYAKGAFGGKDNLLQLK